MPIAAPAHNIDAEGILTNLLSDEVYRRLREIAIFHTNQACPADVLIYWSGYLDGAALACGIANSRHPILDKVPSYHHGVEQGMADATRELCVSNKI